MASAYIKDDQGGTFIPASQRPDGSWRKPRRVRDGYVPQEEVPLYESKGKQFTKNQPTYPVGLIAEYVAERKAKKEAQAAKLSPIPGLVIPNDAKKKKKKNKTKSVDTIAEDLAKVSLSESPANTINDRTSIKANGNKEENDVTSTQSTDPAKRLKTLKKKLREIESLEQKIKSGNVKHPEKDILDKISRKMQVQRDIEELQAKQ